MHGRVVLDGCDVVIAQSIFPGVILQRLVLLPIAIEGATGQGIHYLIGLCDLCRIIIGEIGCPSAQSLRKNRLQKGAKCDVKQQSSHNAADEVDKKAANFWQANAR